MKKQVKKITKATIKSFVRKNLNNLYVKNYSSFDGMTDGCEKRENVWKKAILTNDFFDNKLGVEQIWLVNGSSDYFKAHSDEEFIGYEVINCCGRFFIGVKK